MKLNKVTFTAMAVLALVAQPLFAVAASQTASATSGGGITVTAVDMQGWTTTVGDGGTVSFVTSPDGPLTPGALKLTTTSSNTSKSSVTHAFSLPLSTVNTLSYSTKQLAAEDVRNGNATMRINIDTDGDGVMDDQLMYEPYWNGFNGNTMAGWQAWNVLNGKFWSNYQIGYNGLGGAVGAGTTASNFTIADVLHDFPAANVTGLTISMGTWNRSQIVLVDDVRLNNEVYNFERASVAPCTATTNVHSTSLSSWDVSETRTAGSNEIIADGLHVVTTPSTGSYANEFSKAAGYYATNFPLSQAGVPAIEMTNTSGVKPSLQLGVDKDGNGSWDGYLVYEPWAYGEGNFWSSKNFGIASGMGYTSFGALDDYLNANPNAKVISIGYSLGSGVVGEATITKLTAGCVTYTFGLPAPVTPTPETPVVPVVPGNTGTPAGGSGSQTTDLVSYEYDYSAYVAGTEATDVAKTTSEDKKDVLGADQAKDTLSTQDSKKEWSLVNVLLAAAAAVMSIVTLAGIRGSEGRARQLRLLTIVPAVIAIVAVLMVEDFTANLGWVNGWTLLFAAIAIAQVALMASAKPAEDK